MKHIFIINPAAGKYDRTEEFSGKIAASCASRGLDYAIHVSEKPGDCRADGYAILNNDLYSCVQYTWFDVLHGTYQIVVYHTPRTHYIPDRKNCRVLNLPRLVWSGVLHPSNVYNSGCWGFLL